MSKTISKFRFKQFEVSHHRSSMKVGVDGVLIGCWTDIADSRRILDVGTGCGLIALIMAQRCPDSLIDAIDVDDPSVEEAKENVDNSPWGNRIRVAACGFSDAGSLLGDRNERYDLIVSNPPYFDSGVTDAQTARERARHQGELSPSVLLSGSLQLLKPGGSLSMVVPSEFSDILESEAARSGYSLMRKCIVRGHEKAPFKRALMQWKLKSPEGNETPEAEAESLTLEISPSVPTDEYRRLCRDFYLRF